MRHQIPMALVFLLWTFGCGATGRLAPDRQTTDPADPWSQRLRSMTVTEKVGQLFLLGFEGADVSGARPALTELRAGGIALLSNATSADAARQLTGGLQEVAREHGTLPPIIAVDHEGGLVQRIRGGMTVFGPAFEVGQVQPFESAIEQARLRGATHGRELAAAGAHMTLGPVLDVWDNPMNEVIGNRSFSRDPSTVAALGAAYIESLQAEGTVAVGKHFPGHGNSLEDSHQTLPVVPRDRATLNSIELVPFRSAIQAGVTAIMTAHVSYPGVDSVPDRPASLSPDVVTGLLRKDLGFSGLILTDDMGAMEAITGRYESGEAAIQAIEAGSDMLIVVGPLSRQRRMVQAVQDEIGGRISMERLDASVRRILDAKRQAGLITPD